MQITTSERSLSDALVLLRDRLSGCELLLETAAVEQARRKRGELVAQVDDYLLPRVRRLDAPMLVVIGGSTGAGKSTIANSLIGDVVSPAGVLRPTTRAPVLICHPKDEGWFGRGEILPNLPRTTGGLPADGTGLHIVSDEDVPSGLALLDAPDIDSVVTENRELANELFGAADLWAFVTTAARYADAVPWDLLRTARERGTVVAVILNRVPFEASAEVPRHLAQLLEDGGLGEAPIFTIPETLLVGGLIPAPALAPVRDWLSSLGRDAAERARVVRTTLQGALDSLAGRVEEVAHEVEAQVVAANGLHEDVDRSYGLARAEVTDSLASGTMLRGEVLARWYEYVGTGDLMRSIQTRIGWIRDRIRDAFSAAPARAEAVKEAVESSIESVVIAASDRAAERTVESWEATPAGRALLADGRSLRRSSPSLREAAGREIRDWQGEVLELVAAEGASKRAAGRALSFGVNAAGVALMVTVFAHTGGLTGGELVVAGGTATVGQKLLEALFGDQAVRMLTGQARGGLLRRLDRLLASEAERFEHLVRAAAPHPTEADELRAALEAVRAART